MRPDRMKMRLEKNVNSLTVGEATAKMVDLINIFHSIDHRNGTESDKDEAKRLIRKEVSVLKRRVGNSLATNCIIYLNNIESWNEAKEGYLS